MRNENKFNDIYDQVIDVADDCEISVPAGKNRKKIVSSKLKDYFVKSPVGQNQTHDISDNKTKMIQYFEIIDNILMEMNRRFKQTDLIEAVEACNPNSKMILNFNTFLKLPGISTDKHYLKKLKAQFDLGKKMFTAELNSMEIYIMIKDMGASFLEMEKVYRRILVIPVSSDTPERSFSTMRRIKTFNRSTMTGERLHNLALLSIEKKSEELIINPEEILNKFALDKSRRLHFLL